MLFFTTKDLYKQIYNWNCTTDFGEKGSLSLSCSKRHWKI